MVLKKQQHDMVTKPESQELLITRHLVEKDLDLVKLGTLFCYRANVSITQPFLLAFACACERKYLNEIHIEIWQIKEQEKI